MVPRRTAIGGDPSCQPEIRIAARCEEPVAGENNSRRGWKEGLGGGRSPSGPSFGRGARSPPSLPLPRAPRPTGGPEGGRPPPRPGRRDPRRPPTRRAPTPTLRQLLFERLNSAVEIGVCCSGLIDLLYRVHHRGVVLVVEELADLGVREGRQLLAEEHRYLARDHDLAGVVLALDLLDLEVVVAGYSLDDLLVRRLAPLLRQDVLQRFPG